MTSIVAVLSVLHVCFLFTYAFTRDVAIQVLDR